MKLLQTKDVPIPFAESDQKKFILFRMIARLCAANAAGFAMVETSVPGEYEIPNYFFEIPIRKHGSTKGDEVFVMATKKKLEPINNHLRNLEVSLGIELIGSHYYLKINNPA